eukprot:scaffold26075_cov69-Phaeocystis_antarctica.AAC.3
MPCAKDSACRLGMAISTTTAPSDSRSSRPAVRASTAPWSASWACALKMPSRTPSSRVGAAVTPRR